MELELELSVALVLEKAEVCASGASLALGDALDTELLVLEMSVAAEVAAGAEELDRAMLAAEALLDRVAVGMIALGPGPVLELELEASPGISIDTTCPSKAPDCGVEDV